VPTFQVHEGEDGDEAKEKSCDRVRSVSIPVAFEEYLASHDIMLLYMLLLSVQDDLVLAG
jgi:hypothetical protein